MPDKTCRACGVTKPLDQFWGSGKSLDGVGSRCMACHLVLLAEVRGRRRSDRLASLAKAGGKRCHTCGVTLPLERFGSRENSVDGCMSSCLACLATHRAKERTDPEIRRRHCERVKAAYWRDPEKRRAYSREYAKANPEKARKANYTTQRVNGWHMSLASQCRRLSKKKGLPPSDIDGAYLLTLFKEQGGRCHWLGLPLSPSIAHRDPRRPSVDRLVLSKGYVRGNVVISSMFANMGRSAVGPEQFGEFIAELIQHIRKR